MADKKEFLKVSSGKIKQGRRNVMLHGVNLGGWLMMEAYILHAPNLPVQDLEKQLRVAYGQKGLEQFLKAFRENWITESDIKNIKSMGFNCVRVPFHYRLIETKAYHYCEQGAGYLDKVIRWAEKYRLKVILDLHGACGSQNHDWHSDSYGQAQLWDNKVYQKRTLELWQFLADRYKDETAVAGYDLLNEAVVHHRTDLLNSFYKQMIKSIRSVDKNHILFIEGNTWAQDIACLDIFDDDNYVLSVHNYEPLNFTFNFIPNLSYPLKEKNGGWNKATTMAAQRKHQKIADKHKAPIFVGEFGINYRSGAFQEHKWLEDTLQCFNSMGFHWTYWTYKALKNAYFPDGIYSYYHNPPWVCREGPQTGWNTYAGLWKNHQNAMTRSWQTREFQLNTLVAKALKDHA